MARFAAAVVFAACVSQLVDAARFKRKLQQKTVNGCLCRDSCRRNTFAGTKCDTCRVRNCNGKRFDKCAFPQAEADTWQTQVDFLWSKVTAQKTSNRKPPKISALTSSLKWSVRTTFDNYKNELPKDRLKGIHSRGSTCKIAWTKSSSAYTGLLGGGTVYGFMRVGLAAAPDDTGFGPGWGFMFPRTKQAAGSFVAMFDVVGGQPWNIWKNNISNHIRPEKPTTPLPQRLLGGLFKDATKCISMVGLSDLATYSQGGLKMSSPQFPYKLILVPTSDVQKTQSNSKKSIDDLHGELDSIPKFTKVFNVVGCESAGASTESDVPMNACRSPVNLGYMRTISECTVSQYGDDKLFFRHQRMEEDWALKPAYKTISQGPCGVPDGDWKKAGPEACAMRE